MTHPNPQDDLNQVRGTITFLDGVIEREAEISAEMARSRDSETDFRPGEPEHDALTALRDLMVCVADFGAKTLPPRPEEIGRLVEIAARLGGAAQRADAKMDEELAESQASLDRSEALSNADEYTVRIYREGGRTVNVGPYAYRFQAEGAAAYFRGRSHNAEGAETARIEVLPYDESVKHLAGMVPSGADALAELIRLEFTATGEPGGFPDLYDRVVALHGDAGRYVWRRACDASDANQSATA